MNVLDFIKQEFDKAETFAEMKLAPWLVNFLSNIEHDVVTMAEPYVATAAAQVGADLTSGKPAAEIFDDITAIGKQTIVNLGKVGVSVAAKDTATAVIGFVAAATAAPAPAAK